MVDVNGTNVNVADKSTEDPQVRGDPFKTLFVARLSYDVKESDLEREFGRFGPIERVNFHTIIPYV
jgi:U1 small nuclear ribonucleoprotein